MSQASGRIRVGVNLLWLVPGEVGGTETWAAGLLGHLAAHPVEGIDLVVFAHPRLLAAHPELRSLDVVVAPALVGSSRARRVVAESTWLAWQARRRRLDVVHHGGGTIPRLRTTPTVVTLHDLQPLDRPDTFSRVKRAYLARQIPYAVRHATLTTAVGAYTARGLRTRFGVDAPLTPGAVAGDGDDVPAADLDGYRLDRPWFVYPAIPYPFKNHAVVVRALADVPDALLVLTGGAGPEDAALASLAERLGVAGRVRRTGRVPTADLAALYRGAVACTFPSRYEGVGLGAVEAMAHGCPVIAADATALPEVVGGGGVVVDPDDAAAWAAAMGGMVDDAGHRAELATAARDRAAAWAPATSVAALVAAWRRAGGAGPAQARR